SNPCAEFVFLDETACNLASLNLVRFLDKKGFDFAAFDQAVRCLFIAQEILVDFASYPSALLAMNAHRFRPLGLGFSNFGSLLMRMGISYDSVEACKWAGLITSRLHLAALETSHELALA